MRSCYETSPSAAGFGLFGHGNQLVLWDDGEAECLELVGTALEGLLLFALIEVGLAKIAVLVGKKAGCLHRRLLAVVHVARQQQGIDLFAETEVHNPHERLARGVADEIRERGGAQREGAERRVEMDVRCMDETEGQG